MSINTMDAEKYDTRRHLGLFVLTGVLYIQLTFIEQLIVLHGL